MKTFIYAIAFVQLSLVGNAQDKIAGFDPDEEHKFIIGFNLGVSCSYSDETYLFSFPVSLSLDYHIKNGYYIQFAPKYSWLYKWNEHYLTLPLHLRKRFGQRLSLFLGPCISWDVGYFKDWGISGGAYIHLGKSSSIVLSAFSFTLYNYYIDYRYLPIGISYNYFF